MKNTILSRVETHLKALDKSITVDPSKEDENDAGLVPVPYIDLVVKLIDISRDRSAVREILKESKSKRPTGSSRLACLPPPFNKKKSGGDVKAVGKGFFGSVFLLGNTGKVAKLVNFRHEYMPYNVESAHLAWRREVEIATLAGKHGVGPVVHDSYVCIHASQPIGVIVMEHVNGVTMDEWLVQGPSLKQIQAANNIVNRKLDALHGIGVVHRDSHAGNIVLITEPDTNKNKKTKKTKKVADVTDAVLLDYGISLTIDQIKSLDRIHIVRDTRAVATRVAAALLKDGTLPPLW